MIQRPLVHPPVAIRAWHGSSSWTPGVELRPHAKNRDQSGYGFCLTTSVARAKKYAGRNGRLVLVELSMLRGLKERPKVSLVCITAFLDKHVGRRKRQIVLDDLISLETTVRGVQPGPETRFDPLICANLCLFHDALKGERQLEMARWLVHHGVDAEIVAQSGDEDWLILFNTERVIREAVYRPSELDWTDNMPPIRAQIEMASDAAPAAVTDAPAP